MRYNSVENYTHKSHSGQRLKENLDTVGIWKVLGEGDERGMNQPLLATVEGKLRDIISYAITLPQFYSWGSGGDFILVEGPITLDKWKEKIRKLEEASKLEAQAKAIRDLYK